MKPLFVDHGPSVISDNTARLLADGLAAAAHHPRRSRGAQLRLTERGAHDSGFPYSLGLIYLYFESCVDMRPEITLPSTWTMKSHPSRASEPVVLSRFIRFRQREEQRP